VHSAATITGFALIAAAGAALVAATAWAADAVLRRVPADQPTRLRPAALVVLASAMGVVTVVALVWGLRVRTSEPSVFHGDQGILATPFVPSWIATVVLMGAATVLATIAGRRQLAAVR
jgi:hypothetical protein